MPAVAAAVAVAVACGDAATSSGPASRSYGGPLEDPGWREGLSTKMALRPPRPGGKAAAGMSVVFNRGDEPAVIERIAPVQPSRNLRVAAIYTADSRRNFLGGDQNSWPPPAGDYRPGSLGPARGRVVPPVGARGNEIGIEILVVLRLPRAGRYTFRGVRVDYRVGDRRYWVVEPTSYAICTPRKIKCRLVPPYEHPRRGRG